MAPDPYEQLASRLNALPDGFPRTAEGHELRLLRYLFLEPEAELAAHLRLTLETPEQIAERLELDPKALRQMLKQMAREGLIAAGKTDQGVGYGLMPFVVGIYEMQSGRIDRELAELFEAYYQAAFHEAIAMQPPVHRVVPVGESIAMNSEIRPYDSVRQILDEARAWGVTDCICRKQKALIGEGCDHPMDVCMVFSATPGAFDRSSTIRSLTHEEAIATLQRAAEAGLVHSVSNSQTGHWYLCNCCTCSCGILRGLAEMGVSNVVARSSYVNQVNEDLCVGCELCVEYCPFGALSCEGLASVDAARCTGCGVCAVHCPEGALALVPRPEAEIAPPPPDMMAWRQARAKNHGLSLENIL